MKLHLGCGSKILPGYINIDGRPLSGVDSVQCIDSLFYDNDSVDLIYCCHAFEHFLRKDTERVLKEWCRVLKPSGILRLSVPDFEACVKHYNQHHNLDILKGLLYGGQTYDYNFHYNIWDFNSLKDILLKCGYKDIKRYDWRLTDHNHIDDYSQSYLPHMQKETGMLMSLNVEAVKI